MPSLARFLKINIPKERAREIDGVSLIGRISATHPQASISKENISIKWKVQRKEGMAKIWLATTNNFKTGGSDNYHLLKTVPVAHGKALINVKKYPSAFYKVVLEMPYNILNRWIVLNSTK